MSQQELAGVATGRDVRIRYRPKGQNKSLVPASVPASHKGEKKGHFGM